MGRGLEREWESSGWNTRNDLQEWNAGWGDGSVVR